MLIFLFHADFVSAQTQRDWWYTLEKGKLMFRQGDYGSALLAFEDARRQRRAMYDRLERHLINLLSLREVRRIGDSLDWVERYINDKRYADAAEALAELYYRIPKESLHNSASAALTALGTLKDYPEAEYWIGETYLIEGELNLAQSQFQKALALKQTLENPGFATDLLYKIAAICRIRQDYNEMERTLLSILSADRLWAGSGNNETAGNGQEDGRPIYFEKQAMTRTLENNGVNRFLTLYRYRSTETIDAHRLLGFYYYASGRHSRAEEHLMFAFLIQNTVIIEEVIRNRYDFTFTTLEALSVEINRYPLLAEYAEKNEYYKTAYYLGASLYGNGKAASARELWNFLSVQDNAGEWRVRAQSQLRNPQVERMVEMP
jgi:tetratricopeptide (TPR) repeat protein